MASQYTRTFDGVTWGDVADRLDRLMTLYDWSVVAEMGRPVNGRYGPTRGLWWRVVARRRTGEAGLYSELAAGHLWPSPSFKSVPELLMACAERLERKLQDTALDQLTGIPLGSYFCPPKVREN